MIQLSIARVGYLTTLQSCNNKLRIRALKSTLQSVCPCNITDGIALRPAIEEERRETNTKSTRELFSLPGECFHLPHRRRYDFFNLHFNNSGKGRNTFVRWTQVSWREELGSNTSNILLDVLFEASTRAGYSDGKIEYFPCIRTQRIRIRPCINTSIQMGI